MKPKAIQELITYRMEKSKEAIKSCRDNARKQYAGVCNESNLLFNVLRSAKLIGVGWCFIFQTWTGKRIF